MIDLAIRVERLGKRYQLGKKKSGDLRESFGNFVKRFKQGHSYSQDSNFWALKDINFDILPGETVGIIGRNGAGKSTLLKILSRITKPSTGRIEINGRVSSLLEVGTGFHMELTGRENVFLNGTILGMRRSEIKEKFDEIVAFSGIESFIDTAVKHYSSGMKVRLAFSVAAHLEPEILMIDEVLAVGDAEFQKKCLGKMEDVAGEGRTVLFVSHNMAAVKNLCKRGIVLSKGKIIENNTIERAINAYISSFSSSKKRFFDLSDINRNKYNGPILIKSLTFQSDQIAFGTPIAFEIELVTDKENLQFKDIDLAVAIKNNLGINYIHCSNRFLHKTLPFASPSKKYIFEIENNLKPGNYFITLFLRIDGIINDWLSDVVNFDIQDGSPYPFNNISEIQGMILPKFTVREIQ